MSTANFLVQGTFYSLCKRVNTPVSLGMWLRFKYGESLQIVKKTIDPRDYTQKQVEKFRLDYQVVNYLSKYPGFDTGIDLKAAAISSFHTAEKQCHDTNLRLRRPTPYGEGVSAVMLLAARKISTLLGDYDLSWIKLCKWGPGVTSSLSGEVDFSSKLLEKQLGITQAAVPYMRLAMATDLHWFRARGIAACGPCSLLPGEFKLVTESKVVTVPKNAKTDRLIAIEPTCNQFLQGGVGRFIRNRLRRVGIFLDDQSRNQVAASRGLVDNLATIDLSAASDTISSELVAQLLPPEWWRGLDDIRTHRVTVDGESKHLAKFSAMGNGFTFELETLIFWAITQAVTDLSGVNHRVIVYGDDIICESSIVPRLKSSFDFAGFTLNMQKSHFDSLFRESCGEHFFDGIPCTPVYLRQVPLNMSTQMIMYNQLVRSSIKNGFPGVLDPMFRGSVNYLNRNLDLKFKIPLFAEGDDGFLSCRRRHHPIRVHGSKLRVLASIPKTKKVDGAACAAYWLRFGSIGENLEILGSREPSRIPFCGIKTSPKGVCLGNHVPIRNGNVYLRRTRKFQPWETADIHWA